MRVEIESTNLTDDIKGKLELYVYKIYEDFNKIKNIEHLDVIYLCDDIKESKANHKIAPSEDDYATAIAAIKDDKQEWYIFFDIKYIMISAFSDILKNEEISNIIQDSNVDLLKNCVGIIFHEFNHIYDFYLNRNFYGCNTHTEDDYILNIFKDLWKEYYAYRETITYFKESYELNLNKFIKAINEYTKFIISKKNEYTSIFPMIENISKLVRHLPILLAFQHETNVILSYKLDGSCENYIKNFIENISQLFLYMYSTSGKWDLQEICSNMISIYYNMIELCISRT